MGFNETITLTKESYDDILKKQYAKDKLLSDLCEERNKVVGQMEDIKEFLLMVCLDNYKIKNGDAEKIVNYNSWEFALEFKHILIQWFTIDEMVAFIKKERERLDEKLRENV